ncbi:hypothetical protein ACFSRY_09770 [Pontibacter locisalis]|uniref:Uncharacterized protein n=1 Tax=Pontibacter locisalis TaxID=1719035 RepID=A0ABW5IL47_9BACT
MRKKDVLAAAFALYGLTFVADVQEQNVARQNAPPGEQEQLAKQVSGEQLLSKFSAASTEENLTVRNDQRFVW